LLRRCRALRQPRENHRDPRLPRRQREHPPFARQLEKTQLARYPLLSRQARGWVASENLLEVAGSQELFPHPHVAHQLLERHLLRHRNRVGGRNERHQDRAPRHEVLSASQEVPPPALVSRASNPRPEWGIQSSIDRAQGSCAVAFHCPVFPRLQDYEKDPAARHGNLCHKHCFEAHPARRRGHGSARLNLLYRSTDKQVLRAPTIAIQNMRPRRPWHDAPA
jgi:hypothetical protein